MLQSRASTCARPQAAARNLSRWAQSPSGFVRPCRLQNQRQRLRIVSSAQAEERVAVKLPRTGKMISKTEVPAFIPRDDMMDQMLRWALIEADEGGMRNFGMAMKVHPRYLDEVLWGFDVEIIKEGDKIADIGVGFDGEVVVRHEYVGQGNDGFPTLEGRKEDIKGKHFEIWKLDDNAVGEDLRATLRAFCTGLVAALNKYYAFGSVFAEEV